MKYHRISGVFAFVITAFLSCKEVPQKVTATITGDSNCIDAKVYVDNNYVGAIPEKIVNRESSFSKTGERFGNLVVKLPLGSTTLRIIKIDGTEIRKEIKIHSECYLQVDCEKGIIRGGD